LSLLIISVWCVVYQDCYAVKENFKIQWLLPVVLRKFLKKQTTNGSTLRYACHFRFEAKCEFWHESVVEGSSSLGVAEGLTTSCHKGITCYKMLHRDFDLLLEV
jgi:hypothetical protein